MEIDEAKTILLEYLENLDDAVDREITAITQLETASDHFTSLAFRFTSDERMHREHLTSARSCDASIASHKKNIEKLQLRMEALRVIL